MNVAQQGDTVRAYHLNSTEHAISNISLRRLKVARLSEVNDPFELYALNCMRQDRRKALAEFKQAFDRNHGLLSFSQRWKDSVLWSHYANGGRGMALGFDINRKLGTRGLLEVKYESEKLKALGDDPDPINRDFRELLLVTKFDHWLYEEELRVFLDLKETRKEHSLHFYSFNKDLVLKEVILGPLCDVPIDSVRTLVQATNPGATVRKGRLGFKHFEVKPDARFEPK